VALDFGNLIWTKAEQEYGYPCRNAKVVENRISLIYCDARQFSLSLLVLTTTQKGATHSAAAWTRRMP